MTMSAVRAWTGPEAWRNICSVRDMKKLLFSAMNGWSMGARRKNCRRQGGFGACREKAGGEGHFCAARGAAFALGNFPEFCSEGKKTGIYGGFFCSDYYACEAMDVFSIQGLKLPEELSVTGFDDNPFAKLVTPRLTTIRQYPSLRAKEAVKLLMKRIRGEAVAVHSYSFPLELIVRDSVKNRTFEQK